MYDWSVNEKLNEIYKGKKKVNPRFSIRAFAIMLGMSNSALSQILRNKRPVGANLAKKIEKKLKINFQIVDENLKRREIRFNNLELKEKEIQLPWYFLAVLELLKIENYSLNVKNIAQDLNVSAADIKKLLIDLKNLGYIEENKGNYKTKLGMTLSFINPAVSSALAREYQKRYLEKAIVSVDKDALEKRMHNTLFFRFDESKVDEIRDVTQKYFRDLARLTVQNEKKSNKVYCTQVSSFPLINIQELD